MRVHPLHDGEVLLLPSCAMDISIISPVTTPVGVVIVKVVEVVVAVVVVPLCETWAFSDSVEKKTNANKTNREDILKLLVGSQFL